MFEQLFGGGSKQLIGLDISSSSVKVLELSKKGERYQVEERHGRKYLQDIKEWEWLVILRFHQETICETWVRSVLEDPPCLHREPGEDRQVRLRLLDATYKHPPREGASNGTEARFRFQAELSPR